MRINCWLECVVLVVLVLAFPQWVRSAPLIDNVNANVSGLFEGDIAGMFTDTSDGAEKTLAKSPDDFTSLWAKGIVYYKINKEDYDQNEIKAILQGMKMIEKATKISNRSCIRFVERTKQKNYLNIFSGSGCWSQVGRNVDPEPQDLSLQAGGCTWPGTAAHEFLHALGFWHEQSRPDRDNYIDIKWDNISPDMTYNFDKYTTNIDTLGLPYDYSSIMHYDQYAFAVDDSMPTIVPKKSGVNLGGEKLSKLDVESIRKLYNCV